MLWQLTTYAVILFISAAISAGVALAVWRRRTAPGGMALFWLMLAVVEWQLAGACEAAAVGIPAKVLWSKISYIGILSAPVFLFIFALEYSQQEKWLTRRNLALLWLVPVITFALAVTNEWHHLIWTSFTPSADPAKNALIYGHGAWFWIMVVYVYLLLSTATLVFIRTALRYRHLYRRQAALVLLAMPFPWIANILYVFNWGPFPGQDLTLVGFAITGALLTLNLYPFRLLDLVPMARDALIENMNDGVLVLDAEDRIVDLNPAACQLIEVDAACIGRDVDTALAAWPELVKICRTAAETRAEIRLGDTPPRYLDVRVSHLYDRRKLITGRLIALRDITERVRAEEEMRESEEKYRVLAESSPNGIFISDAERFIYVNQRLCKITGFSREELLNMPDPVGSLFAPEERERVLTYARSRLSGGPAPPYYEARGIRKDGEEISLKLAVSSIVLSGRRVLQGTVEDITERQQAEEEIRQRTAQLEALREVGLEITAQLDLDTLLHSIVSRAVELVNGNSGGLYLYRPERDVLEWAMTVGPNLAPIGTTLRQGEGLSGRVWETGQPLVVDNYQHWEGQATVYEDYPWTATVGVPVRWGEKFLGVLNVLADAPHAFSSADAELLSLFATRAAIAIENARLYESERKRSAELEALHQAGLHLTSTLELQPTLRAILDHALNVVAADDAHIFLYDGERLAFGAALWEDGHQQKPYAEPRPQGLTYTVARSGERIVIPDVNSHPLFQDYQWGGAIVGLPLRIGERVVGVMTVAFQKPHAFDKSELRVLGLLADQAAIAIENARLYEETRQRATELGTLYDVATVAAASIRLDEILNRVMAALQEIMRPDDVAILLVEPEMNELVIRAHSGFPGGPTLMRRPIGVGIPGWVVQTGKPVLLADVRQDERYHPCDPDTRSELCVPLQVGERIIGAINLESRQLAAFSEENLRLLSILAGHLAAVIENARLFEEIEERRVYLEGVLGAAPDAIVTLDARHRIVEWNSGAERLFGYSREEAVGRDLDPLVTSPDVLEEATGFRRMVMDGEELPPVETVRYRKDGSPVDVLLASSPILVGDEVIGAVAVYTDITEHVRAEETLRRRAEELAALQATVLDITTPHDLSTLLQTIVERAALLLNAPGGGMYLCDPDRREARCVVSYNTPRDYTGTVLQYGEGAAGTVAQTGEPLIIDDYRAWSERAAVYEEDQPFTGVLSAPMIWRGQVTGVIHVLQDVESRRFTQADLELLTLFANHAAIAVENTRLYEQAQREISERVRAEETLKEYSERLEEMVEERTLELEKAYSDLRASQARLVQSERLAALGRLAASVAHEINNPLQGIGNYLSTISQQVADDDPLHEDLGMVKLGFNRIAEIVHRLRAFYRPAGEEMELTDVNGVVKRALALVGHQLSLGRVEVKTELAEQELPVLGSAGQLEQVMVNLALNAQEAMPQGGELTVRTTLNDNGVQLQLSDTGRGINEKEMRRLFKPFYTGRGGKGLGLGLWISHNIIEGHGGRIEVESKVEEGTTFTINLPAYQRRSRG